MKLQLNLILQGLSRKKLKSGVFSSLWKWWPANQSSKYLQLSKAKIRKSQGPWNLYRLLWMPRKRFRKQKRSDPSHLKQSLKKLHPDPQLSWKPQKLRQWVNHRQSKCRPRVKRHLKRWSPAHPHSFKKARFRSLCLPQSPRDIQSKSQVRKHWARPLPRWKTGSRCTTCSWKSLK